MAFVTAPETAAAAPEAPAQAAAGAPGSSPDAPVRVEVPMPRALFDRLTEHDDAPRCRYDERFKMGEFVAEPGISHETRPMRHDSCSAGLPTRLPMRDTSSPGGASGRFAS